MKYLFTVVCHVHLPKMYLLLSYKYFQKLIITEPKMTNDITKKGKLLFIIFNARHSRVSLTHTTESINPIHCKGGGASIYQ